MPTGFEKFKQKALAEGPIHIEQPAKQEPEVKVEKEERSSAATKSKKNSKTSSVEERPSTETRRKRKNEQLENLETVTLRLSSETKRKLDEMKFRSRRLLWDLVDEAINDLYDKFN